MKCKSCGAEILQADLFCPTCGASLNNHERGWTNSREGVENREQAQPVAQGETVPPMAARPSWQHEPTSAFADRGDADLPLREDTESQSAAALRTETAPVPTSANAASPETPQQPPPAELWQSGYSPRAMYGAWLFCLAFSAYVMWLVARYMPPTKEVWTFTLTALSLLWLIELALLTLRRLSVRYGLTATTLWLEQGLLRRQRKEIELHRIANVLRRQDLADRWFNVGELHIAGERAKMLMTLSGVEHLREVAGQIDEARQAANAGRLSEDAA